MEIWRLSKTMLRSVAISAVVAEPCDESAYFGLDHSRFECTQVVDAVAIAHLTEWNCVVVILALTTILTAWILVVFWLLDFHGLGLGPYVHFDTVLRVKHGRHLRYLRLSVQHWNIFWSSYFSKLRGGNHFRSLCLLRLPVSIQIERLFCPLHKCAKLLLLWLKTVASLVVLVVLSDWGSLAGLFWVEADVSISDTSWGGNLLLISIIYWVRFFFADSIVSDSGLVHSLRGE